jgi:predicted nucleic acid-binding protein
LWRERIRREDARLITTEAVCWEWLNAMSGPPTRQVAAQAYEKVRVDPRVDVVACSADLADKSLALYIARPDKDWSITDCLSFVVMRERNVAAALTADHHFDQAGLRVLMSSSPQQ